MRLLHITSIVSPHQMPLARCLVGRLGTDNYRYAVTGPAIPGRTEMGWDCSGQEPWILRVREGELARQMYEKWWMEADVVLCGDRAVGAMENRLKQGNLTLYTSERWWKPPLGMARLADPRFALMALSLRRLSDSPAFHYLPIGSRAASDMRRWANFRDRSWLWGYFTALPLPLPKVAKCHAGLHILWAGRMLEWKRVDVLIKAFGILCRKDETARLTLIGDGPKRQNLEVLARRLGLEGAVEFHSSLPMKEVWQRMQSAHIYVLPSNGYEGWGAVVNEAMGNGCAVVASEAAGAAKTMIQHGENGLLFHQTEWRQLGHLLCQLSADEPLRLRLAQAGQQTIAERWSPKVAAERLLEVCDALLANNATPHFASGPMSRVLG